MLHYKFSYYGELVGNFFLITDLHETNTYKTVALMELFTWNF